MSEQLSQSVGLIEHLLCLVLRAADGLKGLLLLLATLHCLLLAATFLMSAISSW